MAEVIIKIKDQPGKTNLALIIDFKPALEKDKPMSPAQAAALKIAEMIAKHG